MAESEYLFFARTATPSASKPSLLPQDCSLEYWTPKGFSLMPKYDGADGRSALVWGLFHLLHLFANRSYGIVFVRARSRIVHRSFVFPGYFRFPFMTSSDVQVGDTWTDPAFRGRGIAAAALEEACRIAALSGGLVWYITERTNEPSIRVARSCGFVLRSVGVRTSRIGLRILGAYQPITPIADP